jgi:arginase
MLDAFDESKLPVLLGGDHSCAISSISALLKKYPKSGIIWIDAHADINTFETSPTGNIHGMPVAALTGMISKQDLFSGNWTCDFLDPKQIVYLGIRDLDPGEQQVVKDKDILAYSAEDLKKTPLKKVFDTIEAHFDKYGFNQGVHVSFDIDGLSSELVPSTGTPVGDGIQIETLENIMKEITHYFDLTSIDCVEFNPKKTKNEADILRTYQSIEVFFRNLLLNPSFMVDRHVFKKFQ